MSGGIPVFVRIASQMWEVLNWLKRASSAGERERKGERREGRGGRVRRRVFACRSLGPEGVV